MFILALLGGLSIESTETPLPREAQQRRRLSLLALLALGGPRGLSRERIQAYLWPESSADRARHALDQLVYTTRRELGADSVMSGPTDLRLDPSVIRPDVWAFDEAIRGERWEEAVELYAGPLLHGIHLGESAELERWIDDERSRRAHEYVAALDTLARAATSCGGLAEAVWWRRRQCAADPFSAAIALETMLALDAAGDRVGAVQHARSYQQLVTTNLEIEPDARVAELADAIATRVATAAPKKKRTAVSRGESPEPALDSRQPAASGHGPKRRAHRTARVAGAVAAVAALGIAAIAFSTADRARRSVSGSGMSITGPETAPVRLANNAEPVRANQSADPEARSLYLRARSAWEKRTKEPLEEAVVLFRRAIDRDPSFAAAYAGLAQSYAMLGYFGFASGDAMFPKAKAAATRAIELDSASGDAYAALGQALAWEHSWVEGERAYERALRFSPKDATAHQWYALLLAYLGRARESATHTGHASEIDPLSVQVNNMHGIMLYYAGDLEAGLRQFERTVDAEPDSAWVRQNPWVLTNFSRVAAAAGRHALAIRLVDRALVVVPSHPRPLFDLAYAYAAAGQPDSARAALARADTTHAHYAVYRAMTHGLLGEHDAAFDWFDRVGEWPLPSLVTLNCERRLTALREDPRFQRVRARLNMN